MDMYSLDISTTVNQNIFNLALDFFRSPAAHDELVDPASPLPPDISSLLDVLAGDKDPSAESSIVASDELRAAICFLIERSFFVPGADYYRVLGLSPGARLAVGSETLQPADAYLPAGSWG